MSTGGTFTAARTASGPLLFVSGQTPNIHEDRVAEDVTTQTREVLDGIAAILAEHRIDWGAVVKLTYYLRDTADLAALRAVVLDVLPEPRPAATLVEVSGLVDPRFHVEIDAVADLGT